MATQKSNLFESLRNLTETVGQYKMAAGNPPDPGSIGGATTHPIADQDNGCSTVTTGARASEYESDIKKDQGAPGVDSVAPLSPGNEQDSVQMSIGMTSKATGEDPSVEDDYKAGKDDPGSEFAARTDNDSLDSHKYASYSFDAMHKAAAATANLLLADIVNGFFPTHKRAEDGGPGATGTAAADSAATTDAAPTGEKMPEEPSKESPTGEGVFTEPGETKSAKEYDRLLKQATQAIAGRQSTASGMTPEMEAGYKLAGQLGLTVKQAQVQVASAMEGTISDAIIDAELVGTYLQTVKQAMEDAAGEDNDGDEDDSSGANSNDGAGGEADPADDSASGGAPPAEGGGDMNGLLGGGSDSSMEGAGAPDAGGGGSLGDILGGGSDPGGMMPPGGDAGGLPPEAGGMPPDAGGLPPEAGGLPPEAGGMPPGGDMGGAPPGGGDQDAAVEQLVAALQELGISPEELAQSGPPPAAPGEMSEGMKLASVAKGYMRSGRYQVKTAGAKTAQRQIRDQFKMYLIELCSR